MSAENQKPNGFSSDESSLIENKTLLQKPATAEQTEELSHRFKAPADKSQTNHKTELETEPTKIIQTDDSDALSKESNENALRPSRLRFVLVCLLFVFIIGVNIINLLHVFAVKSIKTAGAVNWVNDRLVFIDVTPESADRVKVGDEIVSFNNQPIDKTNYKILSAPMNPGEQYSLQLKREGERALRKVTLTTKPLSFARVFNQYLTGFFLPAAFLFTGLAIILLKPNHKQVLITAVLFAVISIVIMPKESYLELPKFFALWRQTGFVILPFYIALLLHLFLVFPERSTLVRSFPNLEWLIYLPVFPLFVWFVLQQLAGAGWTQFNFALKWENDPNSFSTPIIFFYPILWQAFYVFGGLAILLLNYLKADETNKRRIRLVVVGFTIGLFPLVMSILIGIPIGVILGIDWLGFLGEWKPIAFWLPLILIPVSLTYAIARHKVIPVSFVIRRSLQYLLAKSALRLLLILPVLGIVWNIASNPNRTFYEILFNNSLSFYFFIALVIVDGLLMRSRLNEWIDRRFFREQYNQEKILRELTEAVKESDSLVKLSRLVSSKIQLALHPENVYLFFRDDANQSNFSLGYSTDSGSENSSNLKLAADSPILHFMQRQRGTIEFPSRQTDELPKREKCWLRQTGTNLLVPMHGTDGRLAGIFLLGEKLSQIPYTGRDKELLETLANQIALVHENLNLKDRVRHEQKIKTEVLARFEEGNINLLKECPTCGRCFDRDVINCPEDNSKLNFTLPVERTIENRYRLEKLLGRGGMGAVYEATDLRINRKVAVKILSGAKFGNRDALRRFEREAQSAGRLHHKNIVTIFDYGTLSTEGAFLVMELVHGESLSEFFKREGKLDLQTAIVWFSQILDGVETAHKSGIIHRDLKPDNIYVESEDSGDNRLCILDFGLARLNEMEIASPSNATMPGMIMGTLGYMSPEQLRGERVDERADLFAVGVMIYEALYGEKPFRGQTFQELRLEMTQDISFEKDARFEEFFKLSLALRPENRFSSASEMKRSLKSIKI